MELEGPQFKTNELKQSLIFMFQKKTIIKFSKQADLHHHVFANIYPDPIMGTNVRRISYKFIINYIIVQLIYYNIIHKSQCQ